DLALGDAEAGADGARARRHGDEDPTVLLVADLRSGVGLLLRHHHDRRMLVGKLVHGELDVLALAGGHVDGRVGRLEARSRQVHLVRAGRDRNRQRRRAAHQAVDLHGRLVGGLAADEVGGDVQDRLRLGRVRRAGDGVRLYARRHWRLTELGAADVDLAAHALGEARLRLELEILLVHRQRVVAAVERAIGEAEVAIGPG